jgi:hypothetical protein
MATSTREAYGTPKRCVTRDMNKTRRRRLVSTYCAFPSCEKIAQPDLNGRRAGARLSRLEALDGFSPLISATWRFAVSGIAIVCRSMLRNNISREIVSRVASVLAAPGQRGGYSMSMIRLAFAPRFIVYTLSILLTAALLLTVLAYPPAIDLAAIPVAVFAGFTILSRRPSTSFAGGSLPLAGRRQPAWWRCRSRPSEPWAFGREVAPLLAERRQGPVFRLLVERWRALWLLRQVLQSC